ncbi:hypothetical protein Ancab_035130 [Ancistrocladus abbreviatus]
MTSSFRDELCQVTQQFFELPLEEKKIYAKTKIGGNQGYGSDEILYNDQTLDWNDRLSLDVYPEDQCKYNFWPVKPESFRPILHEYTVKLRVMVDFLLKAMACSLNLNVDCILKQLGGLGVSMRARLNYYPSCPRPELVLGLKPHADDSIITVVLPNKQVQGLQILKDDKWFKAPVVSGALFINVGDVIEVMRMEIDCLVLFQNV